MTGMRHLFTAIVNAVEALAVALVSLSIIAVGALLMWFGPLALQPEPMTMVRATAAVWGLAHGIPIKVAPDEQLLAALGATPGSTFLISLIPLGLTAITVYLAIKLTLRISAKFSVGSLVLASATLGFVAGAFLILWVSGGFTDTPNASQVIVATCFFAIPAWVTQIVIN
ncbi:MAG TPA: DUF6350 family protein, partial [Microbacteriaceae bacterium]|nr:DUF6350 family protein [Microbacteriaceae bacterium]